MKSLFLTLALIFTVTFAFAQTVDRPQNCVVKAVLYPSTDQEMQQALTLARDSLFLNFVIEIKRIYPDPGYPKEFSLPKVEFFCNETCFKLGCVLGQKMVSKYELSIYLNDTRQLLMDVQKLSYAKQ